VVIDTELKQSYLAQPGRQEWVTVIECISASGISIPLYIIFKGENLVSTWIPPSPPPGWTFTTNTSGWTNNFHGMNWIKHFDLHTKTRLSSSDEYRLFLCDGHDSHVSAALSAYCLQHRIVLCLLPPHSSHILQPLDVGIFAPLKMALSKRQARLFRSSVRRIEKVEWVEHYAEARQAVITEKNILSAWRGAGLFPENMVRVLHQLLDPLNDTSTPITTAPISTSTPYLLTSSPPGPDMAPSRIESSFELNCELESSLRVGSTRFVELTVELDSIEFEFRAQFLKLDSTRSESSRVCFLFSSTRQARRLVS